MGVINDHDDMEMNRVSGDETLPLYSEARGPVPTTVPDEKADREAVRDFFYSLLTSIRHDSNEDAQAIATKWNGNGRDLKSYPPEMFLKVLGPEDGWFIYREYKLLRDTPTPAKARTLLIKKAVFLGFMIIWEIAMIVTAVINSNVNPGPEALYVVIPSAIAFVCLAPLIVSFALFFPSSLEDTIDAELRACTAKM